MLRFVNSVTSIFRKQFMAADLDTSTTDESSFFPQSALSDAPLAARPLLHPTGVTIGSEFATNAVEDQHPQQCRLAQEDDVSDFYVLKNPTYDYESTKERKSSPKLNSEYFLRAFLKQCREHQSFLTDSICIDEHILSSAYIYYRWARVPVTDYKDEELFFSALFLYDIAIICLRILIYRAEHGKCKKTAIKASTYLYGEPPRIHKSARRKMHKKAKSAYRRLVKAYKRNVLKFMEIKDKLWRKLDYRVSIEPELVWTVIQYLKKYDSVFDISQCNRESHFLLELNDSDTELSSVPDSD